MRDLIDRQAAIKAIDDLPNCYNGYSDTYDKAYIIGVLEELPSVDVPDTNIGDMISRQAAIYAVLHHGEIENNYTDLYHDGYCDGVYDSADMLKDLPPAEPKKSGWTSCREKLPKAEKRSYWICTDTEYQGMCRWTNSNPFWAGRETDWHWNIFDIPQYTTIVAWRELPEPYKEDENGIS